MSNYFMDAIKIAKAIQKDELSILHGKEFKMRGNIKKSKRMKKTRKKKNRVTLAMIANGLASIKQDVNDLKQDVKGLKQDVNGLKQDVNGLKQDVKGLKQDVKGLKQDVKGLKQDVKDINTRLDYIVSANKLKDLPKSKKS